MTGTRGRVVAIDVGSVRIGMAASDPDRLIASPLTTVSVAPGSDPWDAAPAVAAQVLDLDPSVVVVGLPLGLSGAAGAAAVIARRFAEALADRVAPVAVRLLDERFTTATAHQVLASAGRRAHTRREIIDQASAVVLLQHALDIAGNGRPPGELVVAAASIGQVPT